MSLFRSHNETEFKILLIYTTERKPRGYFRGVTTDYSSNDFAYLLTFFRLGKWAAICQCNVSDYIYNKTEKQTSETVHI